MAQRLRMRPALQRLLLATGAAALLLVVLDRAFPPLLPGPESFATVVVAADGTPLRAFPDAEGVWRYPVSVDEVSPEYLAALVEYEDRWFWRHPGVNPIALVRAAGQWLRHGRVISGGSTLTMQVARLLDPHPRSLAGKLRQVLRALQLEWRLSKREILEIYLNHAPYGGTIEGVEAASWAYLGKPARALSRAEAALLAVLPQAPSRLRPDRHPDAARQARDKVLARLAERGTWPDSEVADARLEPVVARRLAPPRLAPLLAERLRSQHPGLARVRSTIDAALQAQLEERIAGHFARLPERTSAALLVVDNATLEVRAYLGSLDFTAANRLGHVDMVRATRSPGSTLKPFLYGLALDDGLVHSESLLVDAPQRFGDYQPVNFDPTFNGPVSVADALRLSLNVPAVDVLDRLGPARFTARLAHAGVVLRFPRGAEPNLSLILGGTGASLEQLVGAYSALQRGGLAGRVRYTPADPLQDRRLLSSGAAWIIREILERREDGLRSGTFDTSTRPRVAWKTGTSYGFRDAWAIGTTARHTVGVWVGRPDGTPLPGQYGAITALPLLLDVIDGLPRAADDARVKARPAEVQAVEICWPLGLPPDPQSPGLCHVQRDAWALAGSLPPAFPERDARAWGAGLVRLTVDADTGRRLSLDCAQRHRSRQVEIARWPNLAYPWLSSQQRRAAAIPPLADDCAGDAYARMESLRIDGPPEGSVLARAPGSRTAPTVRLRTLGTASRVQWLVNGRLAAETQGARPWTEVFATPGEQHITALAAGGAWAELRLRVLP